MQHTLGIKYPFKKIKTEDWYWCHFSGSQKGGTAPTFGEGLGRPPAVTGGRPSARHLSPDTGDTLVSFLPSFSEVFSHALFFTVGIFFNRPTCPSLLASFFHFFQKKKQLMPFLQLAIYGRLLHWATIVSFLCWFLSRRKNDIELITFIRLLTFPSFYSTL